MLRSKARVLVGIQTYNHAPYIARAIDSVLEQHVDFDYDILIGEDCSTDRTRDIVLEYRDRWPGRIQLLLSETNAGNDGRTLLRQLFESAGGDYVIMLDGDDYWTSPHKLAKQVSFLDKHPDCALCFHQTTVVYEDARQTPHPFCVPTPKPFSTLVDLLGGTFISTPSVMYRRIADIDPALIERSVYWDSALQVRHARHGLIGYLPESMAVHRIHQRGWWSGFAYDFESGTWDRRKEFHAQIDFLHSIAPELGATYETVISRKLALNHFELSCAYAAAGNRRLALRHLGVSWRYGWGAEAIPWHHLAEGLLRQASPRAHRLLRQAYESLRKR